MGYLCSATESDLQAGTLRERAYESSPPTPRESAPLALHRKKRTRAEAFSCSLTRTHARRPTRPLSPNPVSSDDSSSDEDDTERETVEGTHACCTLAKRRLGRPRKKRVGFGDVAATTTYLASDLTRAEVKASKHLLWSTKQDRLDAQAECQRVLKAFRASHAREVRSFSSVCFTSMQVPLTLEASDLLERARISVPLAIRGMEWGIAPRLRKRRKEHVSSVLSAQAAISESLLREKVVASRSLRSSRSARIMARIIGEGDVGIASTTALTVTTADGGEPVAKAEARATAGAKDDGPAGRDASPGRPGSLGHARRRRRPVLWRNNRGKRPATIAE